MKILFIKSGNFSHINDNVLETLTTTYPCHKIETIDALEIMRYKLPFYCFVLNIYFFTIEYAVDILFGRRALRKSMFWFWKTSYLSLCTSRMIKKLNKGKKYLFTFQTQSIVNGKLDGIPHFIYTDHTTQTNLLYPNINSKEYIRSKRFIKRAETPMYNDAARVFTFGTLVSWSLINQYNIAKEKVLTVFAGSNISNAGFQNPQKYYSRNILFVGVEWERKGGPMLLKVFEKVLSRYPDATLTILGCKPKIGLVPNCNVVGSVSIEDVSKYYTSANVFMLPTLREPFGIVFIEAMNYKLPIVANNIGCIADIVVNDNNGYLVDNNVDDYADAIGKLFDNPEKCKIMGERGYQYAVSTFNWKQVGLKMKNQIDKSLQSHSVSSILSLSMFSDILTVA